MISIRRLSRSYGKIKTNKMFLFLILIVLSGCFSNSQRSTISGKKLYKTFFVGDDGIQYFINPLTFKNDANGKMLMDITFRYKDKIKDSATFNISFIDKDVYRNIDSMKIKNDSVSIALTKFKYMFSEREKNEFNSRYSVKCRLSDVKKLFDGHDWNVLLFRQNVIGNYKTPTSTKKKIDKLKYEIFALF